MSVGPETRPHEELLEIARRNIRESVISHMLREQPTDESRPDNDRRTAVVEPLTEVISERVRELVPITL